MALVAWVLVTSVMSDFGAYAIGNAVKVAPSQETGLSQYMSGESGAESM